MNLTADYSQNIFHSDFSAALEMVYDWLNSRLPNFQTEPFEVVYGYLSIEDNYLRGGSPRSYHLIGQAIDIRPTPNTDDRKCIVASFAEAVFIKKNLGSEIAIDWGLNGHVHIAMVLRPNYHHRFSINNGEIWSSVSPRNKQAVRKIIGKYYPEFKDWN